MEFFQRHDKKECIVSDLDWQVLDPFGSKLFGHEQVERIITEGGRYYVKFKSGIDVNYGVGHEADLEPYKTSNIFSIAHSVATHSLFKGATVLLLLKNEESEDQLIYAVGLVNGNVTLDRSFAPYSIDSVYERFASDCDKVGRSFTVWGDIAPEAVKLDHEYTLIELLDSKGVKKVKLEELKNDRTILMVIAGVIAIVIVLALFWMWDWYRAEQKAIIEQIRQVQSSPDYMYKESVKLLLATPTNISKISGPQAITQLGAFPVKLAGWNLTSIVCESANCEAHWKSSGGTYDDFKAVAAKGWGPLILNNNDKDVLGDLKTIRHTFSLELTKTQLPPINKWPKAYQFSVEIGNEWQRLSNQGWSGYLKPIEQQAIPVGVQSVAVRNHPDAIYAMAWHAANQDWWIGRQIIKNFPDNVTLDRLELHVDAKGERITFGAEGLAYVQK